MNKTTWVLALAVTLAGTGIYLYSPQTPSESTEATNTIEFAATPAVTVYKDPNCGCCTGYAEALRRQGFVVTIEETWEMDKIKQDHNIPLTGESCHTSIIGDYVVEGHVPLEAVAKLLEEQPDIAGIGLPSMPIGTPGMPGLKRASYEIYQLSATGEMSPYLTI